MTFQNDSEAGSSFPLDVFPEEFRTRVELINRAVSNAALLGATLRIQDGEILTYQDPALLPPWNTIKLSSELPTSGADADSLL